jgi:hypothetical protein
LAEIVPVGQITFPHVNKAGSRDEARHAAEVRLIRGQPAWIISKLRSGLILKPGSRSAKR